MNKTYREETYRVASTCNRRGTEFVFAYRLTVSMDPERLSDTVGGLSEIVSLRLLDGVGF